MNRIKKLIANRGKSLLTAAAKDVVKNVAPNLGAALGGSLGGVVEREIVRHVGGDEPDINQVSSTIEHADADVVRAIREAEVALEEAGVNLARVEAEDRADARDHRSIVTDLIAGGVLIWTAAYKFALLRASEATLASPSVQNTDQLLEYLCIAIIGFYFGSSWGSKRKDRPMFGATR